MKGLHKSMGSVEHFAPNAMGTTIVGIVGMEQHIKESKVDNVKIKIAEEDYSEENRCWRVF